MHQIIRQSPPPEMSWAIETIDYVKMDGDYHGAYIPDGYAFLTITLDGLAPVSKSFDGRYIPFQVISLGGLASRGLEIHLHKASCFIELKIKPWVLKQSAELDLARISEGIMNAVPLFDKTLIGQLRQMNISKTDQMAELIWHHGLGRLLRKSNDIQPLEYITSQIKSNNGNIVLRELAQDLSLSLRSIERIFKFHYGLSPKAYMSPLRLRWLSTLVATMKDANFTKLAADCGYYDQAHFNKEFRKITNQTPTQFFGKPIMHEFYSGPVA